MNLNNLHTFFVYVFFGYLFIVPLVLLCLKLFQIQNPRQRMGFYLLALVAPFAGFILYHTILVKRCQTGHLYSGIFWQWLDYVCGIGNGALRILGPVVALMVFGGLLKTVATKVYIQRLQFKAVNPSAEEVRKVREMVEQQSRRLGLRVPKVIFSGSRRFSSFITGFFRPIIVISLPLIKQLTDSELQTILTHELIHIRRGDTTKGWLLHLLKDLMFFSPFSLYLLNRYMLERERLCDGEVILELGNPRSYAATLLKTWRLLLESNHFTMRSMVGFSGKKHDMEQRILSILAFDKQVNTIPGGHYYALIFLVGSLVILYLGLIC